MTETVQHCTWESSYGGQPGLYETFRTSVSVLLSDYPGRGVGDTKIGL